MAERFGFQCGALLPIEAGMEDRAEREGQERRRMAEVFLRAEKSSPSLSVLTESLEALGCVPVNNGSASRSRKRSFSAEQPPASLPIECFIRGFEPLEFSETSLRTALASLPASSAYSSIEFKPQGGIVWSREAEPRQLFAKCSSAASGGSLTLEIYSAELAGSPLEAEASLVLFIGSLLRQRGVLGRRLMTEYLAGHISFFTQKMHDAFLCRQVAYAFQQGMLSSLFFHGSNIQDTDEVRMWKEAWNAFALVLEKIYQGAREQQDPEEHLLPSRICHFVEDVNQAWERLSVSQKQVFRTQLVRQLHVS